MIIESISHTVEIKRNFVKPAEQVVRKLAEDYSKSYMSYRNAVWLDNSGADYFIIGRIPALEFLLQSLNQSRLVKLVKIGTSFDQIQNVKFESFPMIGESAIRGVLEYYEAAQSEVCRAYHASMISPDNRFVLENWLGASSVYEEFLAAIGQSQAALRIANFAINRLNAQVFHKLAQNSQHERIFTH